MDMAFIQGVARVNFECFHVKTILVIPHIPKVGNFVIICYVYKNELLPNFWGFFAQI